MLELANTNSFDNFAVSWDSGGTNTIAVTNNGNADDDASAATGTGSATLVYRAEEVALSSAAKVNEGDSYRITVNGNNYDYIAGKNETMEGRGPRPQDGHRRRRGNRRVDPCPARQ